MKPELTEMDNSESCETNNRRADLIQLFPKAYRYAKLHLEADRAKAWKQQVRNLKEVYSSETNHDSVRATEAAGENNGTSQEWIPLKPSSSSVKTEICHGGKTEVMSVRVTLLPPVDPEPRSTLWTEIESNIRVNPCCSDNDSDIDEDEELRKVLTESANVGGSTSKKAASFTAEDLKDDQVFIAFVDILLEFEYKSTPSEAQIRESEIFPAICEECPEAGFPFELRDRYRKLTGAGKKEAPGRKEALKALTRQKIMAGYENKFCRRCYVYNCMLHGKKQMVELSGVAHSPANFDDDDNPCGPDCYKLPEGAVNTVPDGSSEGTPVPHKESEDCYSSQNSRTTDNLSSIQELYIIDKTGDCGKQSSCGSSVVVLSEPDAHERRKQQRYFNAKMSSSTSAGTEDRFRDIFESVDNVNHLETDDGDRHSFDSGWTIEEIALYVALKPVFPEQYCAISATMVTKTCREVQKFAEAEHFDSAIGTLAGSRRTSESLRQSFKAWRSYSKKEALLTSLVDKPSAFPLYTPCNHSGECRRDNCPCLVNKLPCEKFCACFYKSECKNQFPGCRCVKGKGKCCENGSCVCVSGQRECDTDLCACGAGLQASDSSFPCQNTDLQNRGGKKLKIGVSNIAGWGLFAAEAIKKDEFVREYLGEIITMREGDRRGLVYDQNKRTYLFTRDTSYTLDGMHFGNSTRFMNSSKNPNCYPMVKSVYGDVRIGLYAERDIAEGEELTFNYMQVIEVQSESGEVPSGSEVAKAATKYARLRSQNSSLTSSGYCTSSSSVDE